MFCILPVCLSSGHECGARQPVQQQAEETAETTEICRMSGQKGKSLLPHIVLNEFIRCVTGVILTVVCCTIWSKCIWTTSEFHFFHYTTVYNALEYIMCINVC